MSTSEPSPSLIIATYNWREALDIVLLSALRQSVIPQEIIIADDGSREDTRELIDSYRAKFDIPLHHVWHEDDGFRKCAILNKSILKAKGSYIVQIDGDVVLHPEFIRDHRHFARPGTYCPAGRTLMNETLTREVMSTRRTRIRAFEKGMKRPINSLRLPWLARWIYPDGLSYKDVRGVNMAYWRSDVIAVNGYNEDISGWGYEDTEIAARLTFHGIKRRKLKFAAKQFHLHHPESERKLRDDNDAELNRTIQDRRIRCENGIDSYRARPA